jgi:hypothetical protein
MFLKKHFYAITCLAILLSSISTKAQAPTNDNCAGAIPLTISTLGGVCPTNIYTNANATDATGANNSPNPSCFNGLKGFKDVWFTFTTPTTGGQNFYIDIEGVSDADSLKNPQAALYVGDCTLGLFEEYCLTQFSGVNGRKLHFEAGNMRPNTPYYLQVANFQSGNVGGRFTVCVKPFDPVYTIGPTLQTSTTAVGVLYDAGGPNNNYLDDAINHQFDIRPTGAGCIAITIDSLGTEPNYDTLTIFDGRTGELLDRISGTSTQALTFQVPTNWIQVKFSSDAGTNSRGFKLSWRASASCNAPRATSCANSETILNLPYRKTTTTCNDRLAAVGGSTCPNDEFLDGKDHVFKFTSSGAQCIKIRLTGYLISSTLGSIFGRPTGINVGIYRGCPSTTEGECIATAKSNLNRDTMTITNARLEIPGEYYIVVTRREACTPFSMQIDTVPCLNRLPNAGFCTKALSLNDCSSTVSSDIVLDLSSQGDSTFIQTEPASINAGCIGGLGFSPGIDTPRYNYVFLTFKAQATGKFSFTVSSIADDPDSDVDFNLYGPISTAAEICTFVKKNRPTRSSFGIERGTANRSTGMLDSYTSTRGIPVVVTDTCEIGVGDGVVKTLVVQKDQYYLLWLNDYKGTIGKGGVRLNFTGTAKGVLDSLGDPLSNFVAGRDTYLFPGRNAQIAAKGGISYAWVPALGLDNSFSPTPVASPTVSTKYNVTIQGTCRVVARSVAVGIFNINKFQNQTVCNGEELVFNAGENFPPSANSTWAWTSSTGHLSELSCNNCNAPSFKANNTSGSPEAHTFTVTLTTPAGILSETFTITVNPGPVAVYKVATSKVTRDTNICIGSAISLLKTGFDNTATYTWSSKPNSTLSDKNPTVSPTDNTKYYVTVTGGVGGCTASSVDSVVVNVFQPPILSVIKDTTLCVGATLLMGKTEIEDLVTYAWTTTASPNGLDKPNAANPILTVPVGINTYTLTATNRGQCVVKSEVKVTAINLTMKIDGPDSIKHCKGSPLTLKVTTNPANTPVRWSSDRDFSVKDSLTSVTAMPLRVTNYYAYVTQPGCVRRDTLTVSVDSLPFDTRILPKDTTVCKGVEVVFYSPSFEPYLFPNISFKWTPKENQLTSDTLYNLVFLADTTRFWYRQATNGVCVRKDSVKINVNPIPILTVVPKEITFCTGDTKPVTFNATSDLPQATDWKWKDPGGQEIPDGKGKQSITVASPQSGSYTVTAKIGDCPGSAEAKVTLKSGPSVSFPARDVLCSGESTQLNLAGNANWTYQWTSSPAGFMSTLPNPSVTPTVATTYSVNITSNNGCVRTQSKEYKVATGSLTVSPDVSACTGNPVTLTATGTANIGGTYRWDTSESSASISPTITASRNYAVTYTYGIDCKIPKSIAVTALPGFTARINPDTFSASRLLDQGNQITLNTILTGNAVSPTFAWTDNTKPSVTTQSASFKPTEATHTYKVTVNSTTGCSSTAQVVVGIRFPNYEVPNAFTPNGDNINATFNIEFDPENKSGSFSPTNARPRFWKGNIVIQSFQVYSRWGGLVYEEKSTSVLNDKGYKGWDGKKNGNDMPSDVYVYLIKLLMPDGTIKNVSGEVNLIR